MNSPLPGHKQLSGIQTLFYSLPALSAVAMLCTNRWFTVVDDETALIDTAFHPASYTISIFANGFGQHRHPPLSDLFLHFWLVLTHANFHLLRVPFIVLYAIGVYALGRSARLLGRKKSELWVLGIGALWPYGFHYGRAAAWYCFCFAAVCLLTLVYSRFIERPSVARWIWLMIAILAAIYSNYFCWILLTCLAADFWIKRRADFSRWWPALLATVLLTLLLYYPILHVFFHVLKKEGVLHFSPVSSAAFATYSLYCTFVSESVGPWFWGFGIPAGVAIASCLVLTFFLSNRSARRFFLYYLISFAILVIAGIEEPKHLVLVGPWLILAVGCTIATAPAGTCRRLLIASMLVPGLIGWFGIVDRNYYAAPHWVEPWQTIANRAAEVVREGGIVIGNNPSFFFYLTYALPADTPVGSGRVWGLLPNSVHHPGVYSFSQWQKEGRPTARETWLTSGMHFDIPGESDSEAKTYLGSVCSLQVDQKMVYDAGARWKRRFAPAFGELDWRVELRSYACMTPHAPGPSDLGSSDQSMR
ncbi:MAG TPA: glycosyltransferase family 39 protein [Candidatus Acidoferrum sp.]|nr:glycosyltransferase family 39 protein [Candidatus Acidoferrum sp.]